MREKNNNLRPIVLKGKFVEFNKPKICTLAYCLSTVS